MKRWMLATTVTAITIGAAVAIPVMADGNFNFRNGGWMSGMMGGYSGMSRMMQDAGHGWMDDGAMTGFGMLDGAFDTDGDGFVSPDEMRAGRLTAIAAFDADANGVLSRDEFETLRQARIQDRTEDQFRRLDANGDGQISAEEFAAPQSGWNGYRSASGPAQQRGYGMN